MRFFLSDLNSPPGVKVTSTRSWVAPRALYIAKTCQHKVYIVECVIISLRNIEATAHRLSDLHGRHSRPRPRQPLPGVQPQGAAPRAGRPAHHGWVGDSQKCTSIFNFLLFARFRHLFILLALIHACTYLIHTAHYPVFNFLAIHSVSTSDAHFVLWGTLW